MAAPYMTYSSLVTMVKSYMERGGPDDAGFTDDDIDRCIMLAEARLAKDSKTLGNMLAITGNLTSGSPVLKKPSRWRETVSIAISLNDQFTPIYRRTYEFMSTYWSNRNQRLTPKYYCDYSDEHFLILPTPDQAYAYEMICYITPGPLTAASQANYWTNNAPDCLLYATLVESAVLVKNREQEAVCEAKYQKAMSSLLNEDMRQAVDRNTQEGA